MSPSRILIVGNDVRELQVLSQTVVRQLNNVLVDTAALAQNALQLLQTSGYDTVFTDLMMPDMDGVALAREIRRIAPSMPVILMSDIIDPPERVSSAGIFDYLAKPIDHRLLVAALSRAISHGRASRQSMGRLNNTEILIYAHCYGD